MAVPSPPLAGDKIALRRRAREARRTYVAALSLERRDALEAALARHLAPLVAASRIVGGYAALPDEISPAMALRQAREAGATVAFPAFAHPHEPFRFLAGAPIEPGPFGTMQPPAEAPAVHPDLVLVPLVAVDRAFNRVGHGKGHYDRVIGPLRRRGALLVGLGWPVQRLDEPITPEPWDVVLDGFASPDGLELRR